MRIMVAVAALSKAHRVWNRWSTVVSRVRVLLGTRLYVSVSLCRAVVLC